MIRIFIFGVIVSGMLAGCLPEPLPVNDIPELEERMVVSSQVLSDRSVLVLLTRSFGALDADGGSDPVDLINQIAINDATVTIEGEGFLDTLTLVDAGIYASVTIPFVDEGFYTLTASSPTTGEVSATTQVKTGVSFEALTAVIKDTGFDTLARISYSLTDIPGRNYYLISVQHVSIEDEPDPQDFLNPNVFIHLRGDEDVEDGDVITESFNALFRRDFIPGDTILVQLSNVDSGYYDFLNLRKDTRFNFSDFLGEPVNYPSNVAGGLGWFTLHFPDVRVIRVE